MKEIIEFFQNLTWESFLHLLTKWYGILFVISFLVLLSFFIYIISIQINKNHKKALSKNLSIVRLFTIHYEEGYVYSIDKFNFRKNRKESLDWFYNSFTKEDRLRVVVWLNELEKEDHMVPHHLELHVKTKSQKQPVFCVVIATSINYEKKVIHIESRLFPNIKKITKNKFSKNNIVHMKELPALLKAHANSQKNIILIRLYSINELDDENVRVNHMLMTLIQSKLVSYCNDTRQICSLNSNEIVVIDFKMTDKNEIFAFTHAIANEISKIITITSQDTNYSFKIGVIQRKECSNNLVEEIKLARETSIYAENNIEASDIAIYDESMINQDNTKKILDAIKYRMDNRKFACNYTPILNTYDGSVFGYYCELFAPKASVGSIEDMQDYAMHSNFLSDLNRILYLETNKVFNYSNSIKRFVYSTMELKPNQYLSYIDIYTHNDAPKHVRTIFILTDDDLIDDQQKSLSIVKELKKYDMCLGLRITSNNLELTPEIMKSFDFFFLSEDLFKNRYESQKQILYEDMITRLKFYSGQIISTGISSWPLIEYACKNGIKHVSSTIFGKDSERLPDNNIKITSKLINIGKRY